MERCLMSDYGDVQIASAQDAIYRELQQTAGGHLQSLPAAANEIRAQLPPYLFLWASELLLFRGARFLAHTALDERPASDSFRVIATFSLGAGKGLFSIEIQVPRAKASYPALTTK